MLPGNGCTAVSVCHILTNLSLSDRQHAGAIVNEGALPRIVGISRRDGGSVGARAQLKLLYSDKVFILPSFL